MAQAPHPAFPIDPDETYGQQEHPLQHSGRTHLIERLRALRGRRLDAGDLENANIIGLALSELNGLWKTIYHKNLQIDRQQESLDFYRLRLEVYMPAEKLATAPLLPGELPRQAPQLPMRDNPPPDSRSPLEVVVAEKTAIRSLVRHFGWVHDGPDTLLRCRVLTPAELTPLVEELVEAPGTIADLAAAADQEVA
jgi:hypothetical protein